MLTLVHQGGVACFAPWRRQFCAHIIYYFFSKIFVGGGESVARVVGGHLPRGQAQQNGHEN